MGLQVSRSRFILVPWLAHAVSRCRVSTVECKLFLVHIPDVTSRRLALSHQSKAQAGTGPQIYFLRVR